VKRRVSWSSPSVLPFSRMDRLVGYLISHLGGPHPAWGYSPPTGNSRGKAIPGPEAAPIAEPRRE
jgi:hypothetical protein